MRSSKKAAPFPIPNYAGHVVCQSFDGLVICCGSINATTRSRQRLAATLLTIDCLKHSWPCSCSKSMAD